MSGFLDPFSYLDEQPVGSALTRYRGEPVYVVNREPYAGLIEGSPPPYRKLEPIRLPPAVTPELLLALFFVSGIVFYGLLFLAGWIW